MTKLDKQYGTESNKLEKSRLRKGELDSKSREAQTELDDTKKLFGEQLAEGNSSIDNLADGLARKQAEVSVYESALAELNEQIASQEAVVAEVQAQLDNERKSEATRKLRLDSVKLIKTFADAQIELARMERVQQRHGIQIINFKDAALQLADTQVLIEGDPVVKEKSKVPHAGRVGGWVDEQRSRATRGAPVLDYAWEQTA